MRIDGPLKKRLQRIGSNQNTVASGRMIVEDGIFRFNGFPDVKIDLLSDWTANPLQNRSWQWNTAAFNFFPYLIAYHQASDDDRALDFAVSAVSSWCEAAPKFPQDYEFSSHDHATALRAENALLFMAYLVMRKLRREALPSIKKLVLREAARLQRDSFYSKHTNHGIEQARVLALIAHVLPKAGRANERWELAMKRLIAELRFAFTREGVHVENSPAYHVFVCNAFMKVVNALPAERIDSLRQRVDKIMPSAMRFLTHIVRPDGLLPIIGDTQAVRAFNCFMPYASRREFKSLEYSLSHGRTGEPPTRSAIVFPKSGYLIVRDRWRRPKNMSDTFHLIMKCGWHSSYHRHDDDLNLVLFCGEDWLIDGGAFGYVESSPIRRYLRSKWAHNVPVVDDSRDRWDFNPKRKHAANLEMSGPMTDVVRACARTGAYPGYRTSRELEVTRSRRSFVVNDLLEPIASGSAAMFRSLWHVPADKDVYVRGEDVLVVSRASSRSMCITNLGDGFDRVGLLDPQIEGQVTAVVSWKANQLNECQLIGFCRRGNRFSASLRFEILENVDTTGWSLVSVDAGRQP